MKKRILASFMTALIMLSAFAFVNISGSAYAACSQSGNTGGSNYTGPVIDAAYYLNLFNNASTIADKEDVYKNTYMDYDLYVDAGDRGPANYIQEFADALNTMYKYFVANCSSEELNKIQKPAPMCVYATPTESKVTVNGTSKSFDAYNIGGNNYFKLRDLATVLNGTAKQFEVSYDNTKNAISITSGKAYTSVGGEMAAGSTASSTATSTTSAIYIDGKQVGLTVYNIGGNNYFKLRDIGQALNFGVTYDSETSTIGINTSTGYSA